MKTTEEIQSRIRQLLVRELDRRIAEASMRRPHLCRHIYQHPLDPRKEIYGEPNENYNQISKSSQTIGLCLLGISDPEEAPMTICEDDLDAQRCPYFTPALSKESLWETFQKQLKDREWITENLSAVAELLWVLEEDVWLQVPWWKRLWYRWFVRLRVEPVLPELDPALLPPAPKDTIDEAVSP